MLNDYFDKIYVINLEKRKDRLINFDNLSKKYNFTYNVFNAFNGKNINSDFIYDGIKIGQPYVDYNYFRGQVGCLISHLEVIKICKLENIKSVLIFEDDVAFCDDFENKFKEFIHSIDKNWQFLYLSGSLPEFISHHGKYSKVSSILTTHSYALKNELFNILIETLSNNVFTRPVDSNYSNIHNNFNTYVAMPFLTYQTPGFSDIGDVFNDYLSIKKYL